jgi:magnesium-transporting ATPase (P-type)
MQKISPQAVSLRTLSAGFGLSSQEARKRLQQSGSNDPVPVKRTATLLQVLALFANPLVIILLFAGLISIIVKDFVNATIIVVMVLLSNTLNFIQTAQSQYAAERLKQGVAPIATEFRDGKWIEIVRREVVPDDVIRLGAGDLVPDDARLLESRDLHVQEAVLTGESLPYYSTVNYSPLILQSYRQYDAAAQCVWNRFGSALGANSQVLVNEPSFSLYMNHPLPPGDDNKTSSREVQ